MEETDIKGLMSSTWAEDSKRKKCQRNTCNILPVRILFTVFMFWKNLQTMNSVIPLGSGIQVYV